MIARGSRSRVCDLLEINVELVEELRFPLSRRRCSPETAPPLTVFGRLTDPLSANTPVAYRTRNPEVRRIVVRRPLLPRFNFQYAYIGGQNASRFSRYYYGDRIPHTVAVPPEPPPNIVPHLPHEYVRVVRGLIGFGAAFPRRPSGSSLRVSHLFRSVHARKGGADDVYTRSPDDVSVTGRSRDKWYSAVTIFLGQTNRSRVFGEGCASVKAEPMTGIL